MLNGYLLASKAFLHCHLKETADFERQNQTVSSLGLAGQPDTPEVTREELKNALLAAQVRPASRETPPSPSRGQWGGCPRRTFPPPPVVES